ncbi:rpsU-divergently transcribed protein [Verruconis gallopava]|uniref:Ubiquinone biosynthesis protein n=1 Tax=Verruconis gallopava TaxID=253628 RepID=A0A0D1YY35_9PEZI|nr:rpsU-divergently transcribed protein [Verruconis gallopava]KIW05582.1 rpsU-divergently transcribed protein [Verruconis gallopava]
MSTSLKTRALRTLARNAARTSSSTCASMHTHLHQSNHSYHSASYPEPPSYTPAESMILSAALSRVPSHGFTQRSLQLGAQDAGYLTISTNLLPRGVFELVLYHLVLQREGLKDRVDGESSAGEGKSLREVWEQGKVGVGGRVRSLILERLKGNVESGVVGRWQEALAIMAQPSYIPASTGELWKLADEIWFLAGDTALDFSWYTKRASLSTIYAATEVFQTQDQSTDFRDTRRFLDARLDELRTFGAASSAVAEWANYTGHSIVNVLRSKGVRI